MPIYEYACLGCGTDFELLLASTNGKARCPECGSVRLKKRFSVFSVAGSSKESGRGSSSCAGCRGRSCSTCR